MINFVYKSKIISCKKFDKNQNDIKLLVNSKMDIFV